MELKERIQKLIDTIKKSNLSNEELELLSKDLKREFYNFPSVFNASLNMLEEKIDKFNQAEKQRIEKEVDRWVNPKPKDCSHPLIKQSKELYSNITCTLCGEDVP